MHISFVCYASPTSGDCQTLSCLEEMRCVAPLNPAPSLDSCYDENIYAAFDGATATVNVYCAAGHFIHGIYVTGLCDKLYCLEILKCCRYDTSQVELYDTADVYHSWGSDFDAGSPEGWVLVDADEYITGLVRTGGEPNEVSNCAHIHRCTHTHTLTLRILSVVYVGGRMDAPAQARHSFSDSCSHACADARSHSRAHQFAHSKPNQRADINSDERSHARSHIRPIK